MAHFAELDNENKVLRVLVTDNSLPNEGLNWLLDNLGGRWVQTSYNNNFRGTFAGIGFTYDEDEDIFIAPKPYPSWIRVGSFWKAPKEMPLDGGFWIWNEESKEWINGETL